jgi:hypothetical protein
MPGPTDLEAVVGYMLMYGYIGHHTEGYWFEGPLPSPRCARMLVQVHAAIDIETITVRTLSRLNHKWHLRSAAPPYIGDVHWAIDFEAAVEKPRATAVVQTLNELRKYPHILVHSDVGPMFHETPGDGWTGESCE